MIGGKIREGIIIANWPDILRSAATMVAGAIPPSQLLCKLTAYPAARPSTSSAHWFRLLPDSSAAIVALR